MGKDLEHRYDEENFREMVELSLEKRRLLEGLITLHNYLIGGWSQGEVKLLGKKWQDERKWPQIEPREV